MSAEKAIYALLAADATLTGLVPADKIFPAGRRDQKVGAPAIVYFRVEAGRVYSLQAASGYAKARIRIDVFGGNYPLTKQIAGEVERILSGYRGIIATVNVQAILLLDDYDVVDDQEEIFVTEEFHIAMDFRVHYQY
jgi:hypothetical protein